MYDVIVIGGGPAGSRTAEIVARENYKVLVVEEHTDIGKPTQCTGFVSPKIGYIPEEIVLNRIKKARFIAGNSHFEINSKETFAVMDREKFDKFKYQEAVKAGVEFKLGTRFLDFKDRKVLTSNGTFETKLLIGADGPYSSVAKKFGLKPPENQLFLVQVRAKGNFDPSVAELWFGSHIAPGSFGWVVPENENIARVGLMTKVHPHYLFENFLKNRVGETELSNRIGDVIRYGLIEKSVADRVLLVGDAAAQVKPFSAGGLLYGQIGAEFAAKAVVKALKTNDFSERFLMENYDKKWKKQLGKSIQRGLMIKKIFEKFQDRPFSFKLIQNLGIVKIASFVDADLLGKD